MTIDSRTFELTSAFYAWELRGRGWMRYPHLVDLEPPFVPFVGPTDRPADHRDDARRHTWFSSLLERLGGRSEGAVGESDAAPESPLEVGPAPADVLDHDEFVIALPLDARVSKGALLGWLRTLATASNPIVFELVGGSQRVETRVVAERGDAPHVLGQLRAALPRAITVTAQETLADRWHFDSRALYSAVEFGLSSEFMAPLAVSEVGDEPLLPLVATLAELGEGERGIYQVLFKEARNSWAASVLRSVVTPSGKPFFADAPEVTALAKQKVSSPLFAVCVRVAGVAPSGDRSWEIVRRLASGLAQFGSPQTNELMPLPNEGEHDLGEDIVSRSTHRSGMLLSAEELVSLIQIPGAGVRIPELWRADEKTKAPPSEVTDVAGCLLGENSHLGETTEVRLPAEAKTKHVHVIGSSGTGKSTLLIQMIVDDIGAGYGVGVLDPHGDLVDEVAARMPEERADDVVFFDPSEGESAIGWNILSASTEHEKDLLASDLVGVFRRLSTSWGDQMTAVLANAILVFLESSRGGTLEDLRRFLIDERFRKEILATVTDRHIRSFWETEFELLAGRKPQTPILTRLDAFLRSRLVRRVVAAREPTLDFRQITDGGLIFLGKLATGAIGEENAALLGSLVVSKFHQVTLAREAQAIERRRPFFLYIDEFHHVATPSMASLFSGMRKYQLGLTVAHQDLFQLHQSVPEVERSLLANAYTRICFRVGEEDARQLSRGFSLFEAEDLQKLSVGRAVCRIGTRDGDFNLRVAKLERLDSDEAMRQRIQIRALSASRWGNRLPERESDGQPSTPAASEEPMATGEQDALAMARGISKARPIPGLPEGGGASVPVSGLRQPRIEKQALDYLELVATNPFLTVRERNEELGLSAWRGDRIKSSLLGAGLVREVGINPGGRGEHFKLLELATAGRTLLSSFGVAPLLGQGRGGIAHQWWANTIVSWLKEQGISAAIEDDSVGARVDLLFSVRGLTTAVEIELSDGHSVENVLKDLGAGIHRVLCLVDGTDGAERLQRRLDSELGGPRPEVQVGELRNYEALLAPLIYSHPPPLRHPNENEERSEPAPRRTRRPPQRALRAAAATDFSQPGALTTPASAEYLGLSPATLETLRSRGGGPVFVKLGARVVYRREELDRWLVERERRSTSDPGSGRSE